MVIIYLYIITIIRNKNKNKNFKVPERVSNFLVILIKLMINVIISLDLSRRNIYGKDDN